MRIALNISQKLYGLAVLSAVLYIVLGLTVSSLKERALGYSDVLGNIYAVQERLLAANLHDHDFRQGPGARREVVINLVRAEAILERLQESLPERLASRVSDSRAEIARQKDSYTALGGSWDRLYELQSGFKRRVAEVARLAVELDRGRRAQPLGDMLFWLGRLEEVVASDLLVERNLPRFTANRRIISRGLEKLQRHLESGDAALDKDLAKRLATAVNDLNAMAGRLGEAVRENESLATNLGVAEEQVRHKVRVLRSVADDFANKRVAQLQGIELLGSVSLLLFLLTVAFGVIRSITRPLSALVEQVGHLSQGNLRARVAEGGAGELGQLARAFNVLAERVNLARNALEQRVAERTQDLERTNAALHDQFALHDALVAAQSDVGEGVTIVDKGTPTFVNDALCNMLGYTRDELLDGRSFLDLVHPSDRELVSSRHRRRLAGLAEESRYEIGLLAHGGRRVEAELAVAATMDPSTDRFVVVVHDITARKRAAQAVRDSERRYHSIFQTNAVSIWVEDFSVVKHRMDQLRAQGVVDFRRYIDEHPEFVLESAQATRVLDVNNATLDMFNVASREQLLGSLDRLFTEESLVGSKEMLIAIAHGESPIEVETVNRTLDGRNMNILIKMNLPEDNDYSRVFVSLVDITERKRAEQALREARDQLENRVQERTRALARANDELNVEISERRRLEKQIITTSEQEQQRIGQELHDGLGQRLTGVAFLSKVLEKRLSDQGLSEASDARDIVQLVNQSVSETRLLARGLYPVELASNGLMSALEQLASTTSTLFGIECRFLCDNPVLVYDNIAAINLYRIAQEAVNNAVKHSGARCVTIALSDGERLALTVTDDGTGFEPPATEDEHGMGLHIMQYRANMIGGELEIQAGPNGGTVVSITQ